MIYYPVVSLFGLVCFIILFLKYPKLSDQQALNGTQNVSIVIPIRNEQSNIEQLLKSLQTQAIRPFEIICVDDMSSDNSCEIVEKFKEVKLLRVGEKPNGWNGKAYACHIGAKSSGGDLLLFLDADVSLNPNALSSLLQTYQKERCVVSVQPYHKIKLCYENCSLFFNIVQLAANGTCCGVKSSPAGLFGPVILIEKSVYNDIGGHGIVGNSVVDDLKLAEALKKNNRHFVIKMGSTDINFRMYRDGFKSLYEGWAKNMATGATYTSPLLFALTFIFITGLFSSVIMLFEFFGSVLFSIAVLSYFVWLLALIIIAKNIGNFKITSLLIYPVWFGFFILIFFVSVFKKMFRIPVVWKQRKQI